MRILMNAMNECDSTKAKDIVRGRGREVGKTAGNSSADDTDQLKKKKKTATGDYS